MTSGKKILFNSTVAIVGIYFFCLCLVNSKPFLAPFLTAIVLSLLMLPVSKKLEKWGIGRVYASLINTFFLFLLSLGFATLISLQLSQFISDWQKAKQQVMPKVEQFEEMLYKNTPIDKEDIKLKDSMSSSRMGEAALSFVNGFYSFAGDYLLTFIYVFFMLNYRRKFRKFFIKLFPDDSKDEVSNVLSETANITQGYLMGKFLLMVFLAIIYAVGMGISGVDNFIVISIIASLLTIIPYIGNIIGFIIAIGLGYITSGDTTALIGIIATFTIGQFVESYVLEPYVVGDKVNLDPLITILVVVIGSIMWGVIGMILSVPLLGIANAIFSHVKPLKPFNYLLSKDE